MDLKNGDVIIGFNNLPVSGIDDLYLLLSEETIGKRVELQILRKGVLSTVVVVPGEVKN